LTFSDAFSGRASSCDGACSAPYDIIIASDLVYSVMGGRLLARSVADNLKPGGVFLMVRSSFNLFCYIPLFPLLIHAYIQIYAS
jgi:hypothetical protein